MEIDERLYQRSQGYRDVIDAMRKEEQKRKDKVANEKLSRIKNLIKDATTKTSKKSMIYKTDINWNHKEQNYNNKKQ